MKRTVRAALAVIFATILAPSQVLATDNLAFTWLPQQWGIYDYSPCLIFESDFPTGSPRNRVSDGRMTWNNVNTELWFGYRSPCIYQTMKTIIVKWDDLWPPNNTLWAFVTCNIPQVTTCALNWNSAPDVAGFGGYYWGTATDIPNDQVDAHSLAAHEFGHCVTLWHTSQSSSDMMWQYLNMNQVKRTLTTHDKNSIKAMYAYPAQ